MTKDEALDLALEALENSVDLVREDAYNAEKLYGNYPSRQGKVAGLKVLADDHEKAITAIKQARALDKKAENARELGLDYEPVLKDNSNYRYDPPVAEPVGLIDRLKSPEQHYEFTDPKKANAVLMSLCQEAADALAAQQEHEPENEPFVSLASVQEPEIVQRVKRYAGQTMRTARNPNITARECIELANWIVANTTPPPAQPAVPDAIGPNEDELPAYAAGWNDCRQAMMEMMK